MSEKEVIKSISDKRSYRPLLLGNQMQCLVISDKDAQKSSAALSVGVGSFSDPVEAQGLAHYLEHMLFMGTGKYPSENEYSNVSASRLSSSPRTRGPPMPTPRWRRPTSTSRSRTRPSTRPSTASRGSSSTR